jgi:hypothetical protein
MPRALKKRYCECGRELERYQHFCSECAYVRRQITMDYAQHKYLSNPENRARHISRCWENRKKELIKYPSFKKIREASEAQWQK